MTIRNHYPTWCLNKAFTTDTPHAGHFVTDPTEGSATDAAEKLQHAEKEGSYRELFVSPVSVSCIFLKLNYARCQKKNASSTGSQQGQLQLQWTMVHF